MSVHATKMEPEENMPTSRQGNHQGKRRILIERQPTDKKRNATFLNRRAGLLKKARELATLCGVDVTLIVFSSQGELYEFSSNTKAHILHQYLVKQQEQGHTVDPELVALYYKLAHVEALEHEANRYKYNLELHRIKIDPRLRKFTMHELQNMKERNLLNKFEEVLQNNQKAISEFYKKKKDVRTYAEPADKEEAGGNIPLQSNDSVPNDQPPQLPQKPNEHSRYVVNEGQLRQFQHQVHMGHQEATNMPRQTMIQQQQREFELLMATIERERDLLRCGESSSRTGRVVGCGESSQGDIEQRMHQVGFAALRFANAQGPQQHLPNSQDMHMSYPDQTQQTWWNNETCMNFGQDSWEQHATATQPGLEQPKMFYQPPANVEPDQGQDLGAQRPQVCVTDFQNMYSSNPNQAQESDKFLNGGDLSEEELREFIELLDKNEEQVGVIEE